MNHALCWLALARNRLRKLSHLQNLASLAVLDLSDNSIESLSGLAGLSSLKALIAARNRIKRIDGLSPKKHPALETLVLSHNSITECKLQGFTMLRKLSLAHNQLHSFPQFASMSALAELRLNGNKIPSVNESAACLPKLSILDIGNNLIAQVRGLEPLKGHLWLKSLSLRGNPCAECAADAEGTLKALVESLPKLEIFNDRRQAGGAQKKKKRSRPPLEHALRSGAGQEGQADKKDTPAKAPSLSIHGRAFNGTRLTFADSDDDQPRPVDGPAEHHHQKLARKRACSQNDEVAEVSGDGIGSLVGKKTGSRARRPGGCAQHHLPQLPEKQHAIPSLKTKVKRKKRAKT